MRIYENINVATSDINSEEVNKAVEKYFREYPIAGYGTRETGRLKTGNIVIVSFSRLKSCD